MMSTVDVVHTSVELGRRGVSGVGEGGVICEFLGWALKTKPFAIDSSTYRYGIKVGEPPPSCFVILIRMRCFATSILAGCYLRCCYAGFT